MTKIPKTIHYCWFGGKPIPDDVKKYMETWRKFFPNFVIKRWDESNFDINAFSYTRQAYFAKKYAFVSDVARLYALKTEGGLYLDTDILIKKPFPQEWFELDGFGSFEHECFIETGLIASTPDNPYISDFFECYRSLQFFRGISFDMTPNVIRFTKFMASKGFIMNNSEQTRDGFRIFPQQLLCGKDWKRGRYDDDRSFAVHDYAGTWCRDEFKNIVQHMFKSAMCVIKWHLVK